LPRRGFLELQSAASPAQNGLDPGVAFEIPAAISTLRNVVGLSEAAALEIGRRMQAGGFEPGTHLRVIPARIGSACEVQFDMPYADDHEWLGRSRGFSILIDRDLADRVSGMEIDFDGQAFFMR